MIRQSRVHALQPSQSAFPTVARRDAGRVRGARVRRWPRKPDRVGAGRCGRVRGRSRSRPETPEAAGPPGGCSTGRSCRGSPTGTRDRAIEVARLNSHGLSPGFDPPGNHARARRPYKWVIASPPPPLPRWHAAGSRTGEDAESPGELRHICLAPRVERAA
jgi:hypothetical protein